MCLILCLWQKCIFADHPFSPQDVKLNLKRSSTSHNRKVGEQGIHTDTWKPNLSLKCDILVNFEVNRFPVPLSIVMIAGSSTKITLFKFTYLLRKKRKKMMHTDCQDVTKDFTICPIALINLVYWKKIIHITLTRSQSSVKYNLKWVNHVI